MPDDFPLPRTPGQLIEALLDRHTWTQKTLAIILDIDVSIISKIVSGTRAVDAKLALALAEVFGEKAERFLELQQSFDLAQARLVVREDPKRQNRAHLFGKLPVADMIKRGWLTVNNVRDVREVETALTEFFHAPSSDQIEILPHAAKKTNVFGDVSPSQLAWLYRVKEIASELLVPKYFASALEATINKLAALRTSPDDVRKVPRILQDGGIRYLIVESLSGSGIDGVCFWINESPVIAMSLRYDRIDNFWFVLRHELEHVRREDGRTVVMLDAELEGDRAGTGNDIPEEEREANAAAAEFCVSQALLKQFVDRKAPFFAERDIIGFARTLKIHPGLVAGQLQRRTNRYDRFRQHLVKVRACVTPNAPTDGWGDVYPVGI